MATCDCFVSVIAPVRDQCRIVEDFIADVMKILRQHFANYELVLVDDGSQDSTVEKISEQLRQCECIRLIRLSRSFGDDIAISAGLDSTIGDFVVVMRPEFDPPDLIPIIVEKARSGAGVVFGIRDNDARRALWARTGASIFYWYCRKVLKLNLPRNATEFTVLTRQAVTALVQIKDHCRYLPLLGLYVGYGSQKFVYTELNRSGISTARDFKRAMRIAIDVVTASSRHPLQFVTRLGTIASVINILYTFYILTIYLFKDQVAEGWTTVSLQNAGMFFFVFLILTVMSEYIGQILAQSQGRPSYYVLEERNSSVLFADQERRNLVRSIPEVAESDRPSSTIN